MYGNLPTKAQLTYWETSISQHSAVPEGVLVCLLFFLKASLIPRLQNLDLSRVWMTIVLSLVVLVIYSDYNYESALNILRR